jgi:hypothetical protein
MIFIGEIICFLFYKIGGYNENKRDKKEHSIALNCATYHNYFWMLF